MESSKLNKFPFFLFLWDRNTVGSRCVKTRIFNYFDFRDRNGMKTIKVLLFTIKDKNTLETESLIKLCIELTP